MMVRAITFLTFFRRFLDVFYHLGQGKLTKLQRTPNSRKNHEKYRKNIEKRLKSLLLGSPENVKNYVFLRPKKSVKNGPSNLLLFWTIFSIVGRPGFDFKQFWVPKVCPSAWVFDVFPKTVILSKSSSHCGGSTILKGHTLQKSTRKATPNTKKTRTTEK